MLYRVNAGAIPGDSWIQRDEGGGRIVGEVCHFVDALTYLCGALPVEAQAVAARDHADAVSAILRFADGSIGTIVYSSLGDPGVAEGISGGLRRAAASSSSTISRADDPRGRQAARP